jgi:hypothetical protein
MRTKYLRKQHERALFYIESVDRVIDRVTRNTLRQKEIESWAGITWQKFPFYEKKDYDRRISKDKEFALWLMKRYETVLDNINSHSYAE